MTGASAQGVMYDDRERVIMADQDMQILKECKSMTEAEGKTEQEQYFEERTAKHIALVQAAAKKIAEANPEFKEFDGTELINQAAKHDASKLVEPERTPYISISWRHKLENEQDPKKGFDPINGKGYQPPGQLAKEDENEATVHHITTNSHHPEYHLEDKSKANISKENRDESDFVVDATKMPALDIAEMVADWQAMSEELQNNTAREWFDKQKDVRWHFSKEQEALIDKLLKVFETEETSTADEFHKALKQDLGQGGMERDSS